MKYKLIENELNIKEKILDFYKIKEEDLNIDKYENNLNIQVINDFKEKLLSLKNESFFIVGDADCDGICATTIMKRLLDYLGIENHYYIPSRSKDGYGINNELVDRAIENNFNVLLTVDNGMSSKDVFDYAKEKNLYTLIIDHHEYNEIPDVLAYLHPDILPEGYKELSAGGICGLLSTYFYEDDLSQVYAGLATLADMVGVLDYNRYLLTKMMDIINSKRIYQINYLDEDINHTYESLTFNVIPKINSISRLNGNVNNLVTYLLSDDKTCKLMSKKINELNTKRKSLSKSMYEKTLELIDENAEIIIIYEPSFSEGLCGLVANRLLHTYQKPCLILCDSGEYIKGSGRSIEGFDFYSFLSNYDKYDSFGGHPNAIGLSINKNEYDDFMNYINNQEVRYDEIYKNVFVLNENDLNINSFDELESLKPFGINFEKPLLALKDIEIKEKRIVGSGFPKYIINDHFSAICFDKNQINKEFNIMLGRLERDKFSYRSLVFVIEELIYI